MTHANPSRRWEVQASPKMKPRQFLNMGNSFYAILATFPNLEKIKFLFKKKKIKISPDFKFPEFP